MFLQFPQEERFLPSFCCVICSVLCGLIWAQYPGFWVRCCSRQPPRPHPCNKVCLSPSPRLPRSESIPPPFSCFIGRTLLATGKNFFSKHSPRSLVCLWIIVYFCLFICLLALGEPNFDLFNWEFVLSIEGHTFQRASESGFLDGPLFCWGARSQRGS